MPRTPSWSDCALLLALASLWGASYTFIKIGVATIPPVTLIAGRTLIAGLVLVAVLRWRRVGLPRDARSWRLFAAQAVLNSVVPFVLIAWAETRVEAGLAAILNATTPFFAFLITVAVTRHEPAGRRQLIGLVLGFTGTGLVVGLEALQGLGVAVLAQLAIVLASCFYAAAAIFGRHFKDRDPMVPAAGSLIAGAALLAPASLILDRPWTLAPSPPSLAALLALAVLSTALAFTIYFRLLSRLGSVGTTAQGYLRVPIGVAIGVVALGESLAPTAALGLVAIVAGVAAMTLTGPPSRAAREPGFTPRGIADAPRSSRGQASRL